MTVCPKDNFSKEERDNLPIPTPPLGNLDLPHRMLSAISVRLEDLKQPIHGQGNTQHV